MLSFNIYTKKNNFSLLTITFTWPFPSLSFFSNPPHSTNLLNKITSLLNFVKFKVMVRESSLTSKPYLDSPRMDLWRRLKTSRGIATSQRITQGWILIILGVKRRWIAEFVRYKILSRMGYNFPCSYIGRSWRLPYLALTASSTNRSNPANVRDKSRKLYQFEVLSSRFDFSRSNAFLRLLITSFSVGSQLAAILDST